MTKSEVIKMCRQIGLRPDKAAGQNFLLSENIAARMVSDAEVKTGETVLEIGPGLGVLTRALLRTGAKVIAVELDRRLADHLRHQFRAAKNLQLIQNDIFKVRLADIFKDGAYKLVANLPYGATSLVFRNFLTLPPRPSRMTVMVQKEVAERIMVKPGRMNMLAILTQYYSHPRHLGLVPRNNFWPTPSVTSAVIDCQNISTPDPLEAKLLFQVARIAFAGRRKQLHNTLAAWWGRPNQKTAEILRKNGFDSSQRPQDLKISDWVKIVKIKL